MKKTLFLSSVILIFCLTNHVNSHGQVEPSSVSTVISGEMLHQQGLQYLGLQDFANLRLDGVKQGGEKTGNSTIYNINSSYGYNVADNINVRGRLNLGHVGFSPDTLDGSQSQTEFIAGIGASYIQPLGNSVLFIGGDIGGGSYSWKNDIGGGSGSEDKADLIEYSLGVKYPFLFNDGNSFAVYANYLAEKETFDDGEIDFSGLNFGFGLYNFNTNDRFDICHKGDGSSFSDGHYQQGDYGIGGNSGLNVPIGTTTDRFDFDGSTFESEDALTNIRFQYNALYYVSEGLGIRGDLNYSLSKLCDPDSDASFSNSILLVNAGAQYHIDAVCPSFYGFGTVGAGTTGFTNTTSSGDENSDSQGLFQYSIGVGDFYFIAPNLALNPELYYNGIMQGDGDSKLSNSGLALRLGFTAFLDY
ncbi:MAG: outer membrane beta-barrel protein [Flavobacteriales bacterium]|nr:outer membrane beta-barrel protein [Flavobacteriales bacterium]